MPEQMDNVMNIVNKRRIIAHRFTMDEDPHPSDRYGGISQRDYILEKFAEGDYQVLVAMKCLDMGVNIKPARIAILMASSSNPREYIQRIGRILRRDKNKKEAIIYDIIITPNLENLAPSVRAIEKKIFEKELQRCEYIAKISKNSINALEMLYSRH